MADPIKAAKNKAAKKWAKLDSQTVPLYGKISSGKATEADFKKLASLYEEQSKLASDTFQQSLDAAKASAKDTVKKTIKKSVKANQLLSTPELQKLLETTISIVLEKSADLIRTAVSEALEENIDQVTQLIKDVRRMQVKNDEVLYRLRKNAITFATPNFFQNILNDGEKKKSFRERFADLLPSLPKFPSFRKKKDEIEKDIQRLADLIAAKVTVALTAFDEFKAKSQRTLWDKILNRDNPKSLKSRAEQAKLIAEEFIKRIIEFVARQKRTITDFFFGKDSFVYRSFDKLFNRQDEIESQFAVRTSEQVDSFEKLEEAVHNYRKLDEDYQDEEIEKARDQEATFSDKVFTAVAGAVDTALRGKLFKQSRRIFDIRTASNMREDPVEVRQRLDEMSENLLEIKEHSDNFFKARFAAKAYDRYRKLVFRDTKKHLIDTAKDKLSYLRRRLRRYTNRAFSFLKWFGIAYIASLVIRGLQTFMPTWREDLKAWISSEGMEYLEKGGQETGSFIGKAIAATTKFIANNSATILGFLLDVVKGMGSSILEATLIALGIDPNDVYGSERGNIVKENYVNNAGKESISALANKTQEYSKANKGSPALSPDLIYGQLRALAQDEDFDIDTARDEPYLSDSLSPSEMAYNSLRLSGLSREDIKAEVLKLREYLARYKNKSLDQTKKLIEEEKNPAEATVEPSSTIGDKAKNVLEGVKESTGKAVDKTVEFGKEKAQQAKDYLDNTVVPTISNTASNIKDAYIDPMIANNNPFTSSPFDNPTSEILTKMKDASVNGMNALNNQAKLVKENVIEPAIEKTKETAKSVSNTISKAVNNNTENIPTFMGGDLAIQNLGLTKS